MADFIDRTGETNVSKEGYSLEIVAYRNAKDIDVRVAGKHIVTTYYGAFKRGILQNLGHIGRVGEKGVSTEGYTLEIVAYRGCMDIDVLIDGKYLREGLQYSNFCKGSISNPFRYVESRLGEVCISNEGYKLEIVAYRDSTDIDVLIDGNHLREGVSYGTFLQGSIKNPFHYSENRVGEKRISSEGYETEIVAYRGYSDIDVLIDGKHLVTGYRYDRFLEGVIHNPHYGQRKLGEKSVSTTGYSLEIVAYRGADDIDVLVDGVNLVKNKSYDAFLRGLIRNPTHYEKLRLGEVGISNQGCSMEIVAYRTSKDIDVLVDGKYLVEGVAYSSFVHGSVDNPQRRIGETRISTEGCLLEIVSCTNAQLVDVQMDGDYIQKDVVYSSFNLGNVKNPYFKGVLGVGYIGVGAYSSAVACVDTPQYMSWYGMLTRCYCKKFLQKQPSYIGCTAKFDWHNYQMYAQWYDENKYEVAGEITVLDKDILIKGNREYGPDSCIFVPMSINSLFTTRKRRRGDYPLGVAKKGKKFSACMSYSILAKTRKDKHLGTFATPEEAFDAYKEAKEAYIKQVADEYKDKIPKKLYDALYAYKIEITD